MKEKKHSRMKTEIQPQESCRAEAFSLWMTSPMPMVTMTKTMDVSRLVKLSRKSGLKFNMLLCWCIGMAASKIDVFYIMTANGKLYRYDKLAINVVVENSKGDINNCDIPFSEDLHQFNRDYMALTAQAATECRNTVCPDCMIIGTSAMIQTEIDSIVNQYNGKYNNPFLAWGKYRKRLFKTTLPVSLQFHHVQMDGSHAATFLESLQQVMLHTVAP